MKTIEAKSGDLRDAALFVLASQGLAGPNYNLDNVPANISVRDTGVIEISFWDMTGTCYPNDPYYQKILQLMNDKKYYFILGSSLCKSWSYANGADEFIKDNEDIEGDLICFDPSEDSPAAFVQKITGWMDAEEIEEEDYIKLKEKYSN